MFSPSLAYVRSFLLPSVPLVACGSIGSGTDAARRFDAALAVADSGLVAVNDEEPTGVLRVKLFTLQLARP